MKGRKRKKNLKRKNIFKETQNPLGESQYKQIKIVQSFGVIYIEYDSDGDLYFLQFLLEAWNSLKKWDNIKHII